MRNNPTQLWDAPRCGAKTRGARGGRPCRSPAMANGRCRMHGGTNPGAPRDEKHGMYRHGRYTRKTKALGKWARQVAKDGEVLLATTMDRVGLRPPKPIRRRKHVREALAKVKGEQK
jgi:hypothetical protein